jgi:iron(III) transport system ATP-binding protein
MSTLELNAIHKSYGPLCVAENIDLSVETGSRTAIVGPSGSGKTTLLRMIAGFEFPDSGKISLNGRVLADGPAASPAHQRRIGYVPQDGALFPHMSIAANIGFGLSGNKAGKLQRVAELMELVELDSRMLKSWPHELSGGQQQRVALARALAQRPTLMLLDEPFSALDTGLRTSIRKVVEQVLAETGVTSILVTHDQAEALSFANQLAVMRQGKLVQVGRPRDLYMYPGDEEAARFLGDAIIVPARLQSGWANCELGQIPVRDRARTGNVQIMLRPEQLQLCDTVSHENRLDGCLATVTESDFCGHASLLTLQLPNPLLDTHHGGRVIQVRSLSIHAPEVGSTVCLSVIGHAHVL